MTLAIVFIVLAVLIVLFAVLFRALILRSSREACNLAWLQEFSLETYAPMERLLDKDDLVFLASQPGYSPKIGKRLMAERRRIFRDYVRLLTRDFNRLIALGKLMVVYSTKDRPELAQALWRQQVSFYLAVCAVRCRVALYPMGWWNVDVRGLIQAVESVRDQIQELAARRAIASELS